MKGLELSKKYFFEYGIDFLKQEFNDIYKYIAVGSVGSGSDKYGFDDDISMDHDYSVGFCIFIPDEDIIDEKTVFKLQRAYSKLPNEYMGIKRQILSPVGGNRDGVIRTKTFYEKTVGLKNNELTIMDWLTIPDYCLFESTDGEVFIDNYGEFTNIRNYLRNMPSDIKYKRIAGNLLLMAQSGQYNFMRCIKRGEIGAAQFAINEFVTSALKIIFLLNNKYCPYYKWSFRALKEIDQYDDLYKKLIFILTKDNNDENIVRQKNVLIEEVAAYYINILNQKNMTKSITSDLESHAYSLNDYIKNNDIRNMNIFIGV